MTLSQTDPKIAELIAQEQQRQASTLELIASENHVSAAVMEAAGTVLTNKYAEGYPGARYYGGCAGYKKNEKRARDPAQNPFFCPLGHPHPHTAPAANPAPPLSPLRPPPP